MPTGRDDSSTTVSRTGLAVTVGIVLVLAALIIPAMNHAREAARRTQSKNTLKQVGLALHNYHDVDRVFPPGGVFNADGVAYHEWTTLIAPYLDASHWYNGIDFDIPWDDPQQVDLFRERHHHQSHYWVNPSLPDPVRPDRLISNHYAGSQNVFYRNSTVSLEQLGGSTERLLVADAYGQFLPAGAPYGWREITLGLSDDPGGFGCSVREITQCLMADGSVRELPENVDANVLQALAGPADQRPTESQVRRIAAYPLIDVSSIWTVEERWTDVDGDAIGRPGLEYLKTSPDGRTTVRQR